MNKLLLILIVTSCNAYSYDNMGDDIKTNNERLRQMQNWSYQQNMQQLQQEQNRILQQQSDDYYLNNLRNNSNIRQKTNCSYSWCD